MNPSKFFNTPPAKIGTPINHNAPASIRWRANATGQAMVSAPHTLGAPGPATSAHASAVHHASMVNQAARVPRLANLALAYSKTSRAGTATRKGK